MNKEHSFKKALKLYKQNYKPIVLYNDAYGTSIRDYNAELTRYQLRNTELRAVSIDGPVIAINYEVYKLLGKLIEHGNRRTK